ncbi:MAG: hypothetical protein CMK07_05340 [Ponticaulis sp.]|nr:hypothetical protein [Ponticaulis sp.]
MNPSQTLSLILLAVLTASQPVSAQVSVQDGEADSLPITNLKPDLSGLRPLQNTFAHSYGCRPLNISEVVLFPTKPTDFPLPGECEVRLQITPDGHSDIRDVSCNDELWVEHTKRAFEEVIWSTEEKGCPCSGVEEEFVFPAHYANE